MNKIPIIALIGQQNVGKSTLFNVLTHSRDSLVLNIPGTTRDRIYGSGYDNNQKYIFIDTGGINDENSKMQELINYQTELAIKESDLILYIINGKKNISLNDKTLTKKIRSIGKLCILIINKIDNQDLELAKLNFFDLGFLNIIAISALHKRNIYSLFKCISQNISQKKNSLKQVSKKILIKFSIIGRPNVGKSTLVNKLVNQNHRVLTNKISGTTRDSVSIYLEKDKYNYIITDTAGIRKNGKIKEITEKFAILKTFSSIKKSHISVIICNAEEGLKQQDLHILNFSMKLGTSILLIFNKWDCISLKKKNYIKKELTKRFLFTSQFIKIVFISALYENNFNYLFKIINNIYYHSNHKFSTQKLTKVLQEAVKNHKPPLVCGKKIKFYLSHYIGNNPYKIIIYGKRTNYIKKSYIRYLSSFFKRSFKLIGIPFEIKFKEK